MKINIFGRLFRSQKGFNDTFAMISLNRFFDSKLHVWSVLHVKRSGGPPKNRKNAILAKWMYFYPRCSQKNFNDTFAMISLMDFLFWIQNWFWRILLANASNWAPKKLKAKTWRRARASARVNPHRKNTRFLLIRSTLIVLEDLKCLDGPLKAPSSCF